MQSGTYRFCVFKVFGKDAGGEIGVRFLLWTIWDRL